MQPEVHTLGGDFNVGLYNTIHLNQPTSLFEWSASLGLTHPQNPHWETTPTYLGGQDTSRIDHAFYSANTRTFLDATIYTGDTTGSYTDHRAISLELSLQNGRGLIGIRHTAKQPQYKAILIPTTPRRNRAVSGQNATMANTTRNTQQQ